MKTFTYAGTAREDNGQIVFRATNRDGYARILEKEGKTDINIMSLPYAMTKEQAQTYTGFASDKPVKAGKTETVAGIRVNPTKTTVKATQEQPAKTEAEIAAIRAKNLETIQKVGKRYEQMAERLAEMDD
jgi:hypothetical protein